MNELPNMSDALAKFGWVWEDDERLRHSSGIVVDPFTIMLRSASVPTDDNVLKVQAAAYLDVALRLLLANGHLWLSKYLQRRAMKDPQEVYMDAIRRYINTVSDARDAQGVSTEAYMTRKLAELGWEFYPEGGIAFSTLYSAGLGARVFLDWFVGENTTHLLANLREETLMSLIPALQVLIRNKDCWESRSPRVTAAGLQSALDLYERTKVKFIRKLPEDYPYAAFSEGEFSVTVAMRASGYMEVVACRKGGRNYAWAYNLFTNKVAYMHPKRTQELADLEVNVRGRVMQVFDHCATHKLRLLDMLRRDLPAWVSKDGMTTVLEAGLLRTLEGGKLARITGHITERESIMCKNVNYCLRHLATYGIGQRFLLRGGTQATLVEVSRAPLNTAPYTLQLDVTDELVCVGSNGMYLSNGDSCRYDVVAALPRIAKGLNDSEDLMQKLKSEHAKWHAGAKCEDVYTGNTHALLEELNSKLRAACGTDERVFPEVRIHACSNQVILHIVPVVSGHSWRAVDLTDNLAEVGMTVDRCSATLFKALDKLFDGQLLSDLMLLLGKIDRDNGSDMVIKVAKSIEVYVSNLAKPKDPASSTGTVEELLRCIGWRLGKSSGGTVKPLVLWKDLGSCSIRLDAGDIVKKGAPAAHRTREELPAELLKLLKDHAASMALSILAEHPEQLKLDAKAVTCLRIVASKIRQ